MENPPPQGGTPEVLDARVLASLFSLKASGGAELLPEIVRIFQKEEPPRIAALARLAAERDRDGLRTAAHQVAGACSVLGAKELQRATLDLENCAVEGDWARLPARVTGVENAWARLQAALAEAGLWPPRAPA